jgi:Protein of unknown function (DUF3630)
MQQLSDTFYTLKKDNLIEFRFAQYFDQDDIQFLVEELLSVYPNCTVIEQINGVDRAYFRCRIAQYYALLHFETYSQSSWLEPESDNDIAFISLF